MTSECPVTPQHVTPDVEVRTAGYIVLSQTEIDADYGGDADIREFLDGGTVYRNPEEAIFSHPVAADPNLIIVANYCYIERDFLPEAVYLYEVAIFGDVCWTGISGTTESLMRVLAWGRYASVPSGLAFYSFETFYTPDRTP